MNRSDSKVVITCVEEDSDRHYRKHIICIKHCTIPSCIGLALIFILELMKLKQREVRELEVTQQVSWRRQWHPTPVLLPGKCHGRGSLVGCSPWGHKESDMTERLHFHALEKEMATHCSVLAWRIPGTGEPGGLPFHRVGHDWSDLAAAAAASKCGAGI